MALDDEIRREVIQQIMCNDSIGFETLGSRFGIDANNFFAPEFVRLNPLANEGLIDLQPGKITLTESGRLPRHPRNLQCLAEVRGDWTCSSWRNLPRIRLACKWRLNADI